MANGRECVYTFNGQTHIGNTAEKCDLLKKRYDAFREKHGFTKKKKESKKESTPKEKKKISFKNLGNKVKETVANMKKGSKARKTSRRARRRAKGTYNPYD